MPNNFIFNYSFSFCQQQYVIYFNNNLVNWAQSPVAPLVCLGQLKVSKATEIP